MVENDEDRGGRDAGDVSDEDDRLDAEASDDDDDDEDDDEDSQLASVGGSTLTVKYKARPGSASTGRLSPAATTIDRKSCRSPHPDVLIRRVESRIVLDDSQPCAVLIKPPLSVEMDDKSSSMTASSASRSSQGRIACILCVVFLVILLLGAAGIGVLFWRNLNRTTGLWTSASSAPTSPNAEAAEFDLVAADFPPTESSCTSRSSLGFKSDLFLSGYDVARVGVVTPVAAVAKPVLLEGSLDECIPATSPTSAGDCQVEVRAEVIDSMSAYRRWIRHHVDVDDEEATLAAGNVEYAQVLRDLTVGQTVLLARVACPRVRVSHAYRPTLSPAFVDQLAGVADADRESAVELIEDYGTHYVESAVLGRQIVIRFVLNRTASQSLSAKNISAVDAAEAAAQYVAARANLSLAAPTGTRLETALDFMAAADADTDADADVQGDDGDVLSLRLQPLENLFVDWPDNDQLVAKWRHSRMWSCWRLRARGLASRCPGDDAADNADVGAFTLPLVSVSTNASTVLVRATAAACTRLCRDDPLCSAATMGVRDGRHDANCALHRHQEFNNSSVSVKAVTSVLVRPDLRPVALRGFWVQGGRPLYATSQLADVASCTRLCAGTPRCRIASFGHHRTADDKACRLFADLTGPEMRQDVDHSRHHKPSTVVFLMAVLGPCFADEAKLHKQAVCNTGAECWNGVCVCRRGFVKTGNICRPTSNTVTNELDDQPIKKTHQARKTKHRTSTSTTPTTPTTTPSTTTSTTTTTTTPTTTTTTTPPPTSTTTTSTTTSTAKSRTTLGGYYIRGVLVPAKATPASMSQPSDVTTDATSRSASVYTPWQMRSWSGRSNDSKAGASAMQWRGR